MAFNSLIRSSIKRAAPLAGRLLGGQRLIHHSPSPLFTAAAAAAAISPRQFAPASFLSARNYASPATKRPSNEQTLLEIIESEIVFAKESAEESNESAQEVPEGFPFKIEDNPGQNTISLSREYQGETVNVEVYMPDLITGEEDDNDSADDNEKSNQSHIPMVVRVIKTRGPLLEFGVTAYPDEIAIDSLSVKNPELSEDQIAYDGPDFSDLDENLQKAFHKYLEIRGIKPITTNFLHEYMINKDSREYLRWLDNLKQFVKA